MFDFRFQIGKPLMRSVAGIVFGAICLTLLPFGGAVFVHAKKPVAKPALVVQEKNERRERAARAKLRGKAKSPEERELLELQDERWEAYAEKDLKALRRILAEDYTVTFEDGLFFNKAQVLLMVEHRPEGEQEHLMEDPKVKIYGALAVITGRYIHQYENNDQPAVRAMRYTDTYVKRGRRWYLAASQFSLLSK